MEDVLDEILENNPYDPLLDEELNADDDDELFGGGCDEAVRLEEKTKEKSPPCVDMKNKRYSPEGSKSLKHKLNSAVIGKSARNSNLITLTKGADEDSQEDDEEEEEEKGRRRGKFRSERSETSIPTRVANRPLREIPDSLDKVVVQATTNDNGGGGGQNRPRGGPNARNGNRRGHHPPHHQQHLHHGAFQNMHRSQAPNNHNNNRHPFPLPSQMASVGVSDQPGFFPPNSMITPKIHINPNFRHQMPKTQRFSGPGNMPAGGLLPPPPQDMQMPPAFVGFEHNQNHPNHMHHPGAPFRNLDKSVSGGPPFLMRPNANEPPRPPPFADHPQNHHHQFNNFPNNSSFPIEHARQQNSSHNFPPNYHNHDQPHNMNMLNSAPFNPSYELHDNPGHFNNTNNRNTSPSYRSNTSLANPPPNIHNYNHADTFPPNNRGSGRGGGHFQPQLSPHQQSYSHEPSYNLHSRAMVNQNEPCSSSFQESPRQNEVSFFHSSYSSSYSYGYF